MMLYRNELSARTAFASYRHCLELSCRWDQDQSIVLREIPGLLICVRLYAVAWPRALGCLTSFTSERTIEYRERKWKAQQLLWEGNMTHLKLCSVPWVGLTAWSCKGKKVAQGKWWYCRTGTWSSFDLPHGKSRKKGSLSALAKCIQVCVRVCKRQ